MKVRRHIVHFKSSRITRGSSSRAARRRFTPDMPAAPAECDPAPPARIFKNFYRENVKSSRNRENNSGRRHNFPAKTAG
jgi:hypothetical protein